MRKIGSSRASPGRAWYLWLAAFPAVAIAVALVVFTQSAMAATAPVGLGRAGSYAVLAGSTVTNTGPSVISGNLGVSPGTAVTGFPPGTVNSGTIHAADAAAAGAQADLTTAYNDAAGRVKSASIGGFIGAGQTLAPGVYNATSSLDVGGSLTLDAHGDAGAVFIFQAGSHPGHQYRQQDPAHRRGAGLQRVLAGGQLGHPEDEFHLPGHHLGPDLDHGADR